MTFLYPFFLHSYNMTRRSQSSNFDIAHNILMFVRILNFTIPSWTPASFIFYWAINFSQYFPFKGTLHLICHLCQGPSYTFITGLINVPYSLIVLLRRIYLDLKIVCREEQALLATRILAFISSVSSLILSISIHKYFKIHTVSMSYAFFLGNSSVSEFYMPTFRNPLSVPSS